MDQIFTGINCIMEMIPISAKTSLNIFLYVYKANMYFLKGDRVLIVWKIDVLLTPPPPRSIIVYCLMIFYNSSILRLSLNKFDWYPWYFCRSRDPQKVQFLCLHVCKVIIIFFNINIPMVKQYIFQLIVMV